MLIVDLVNSVVIVICMVFVVLLGVVFGVDCDLDGLLLLLVAFGLLLVVVLFWIVVCVWSSMF